MLPVGDQLTENLIRSGPPDPAFHTPDDRRPGRWVGPQPLPHRPEDPIHAPGEPAAAQPSERLGRTYLGHELSMQSLIRHTGARLHPLADSAILISIATAAAARVPQSR